LGREGPAPKNEQESGLTEPQLQTCLVVSVSDLFFLVKVFVPHQVVSVLEVDQGVVMLNFVKINLSKHDFSVLIE
jgi:hypothetical protein